jgi:hypothetical protein
MENSFTEKKGLEKAAEENFQPSGPMALLQHGQFNILVADPEGSTLLITSSRFCNTRYNYQPRP